MYYEIVIASQPLKQTMHTGGMEVGNPSLSFAILSRFEAY